MPFAPNTRYTHIRRYLETGDLMVLRNPGLVSWVTRSPASHVGTLLWREADQNSLSVAESREGRGGQVLSLSSQVRRFPGQIDIYRPTNGCPQAVRERAATICLNWAGYGYNYPGIWNQWIGTMPLLRLFSEKVLGKSYDLHDLTLSPWEAAKYCSQLVGWSYRRAVYELELKLDWDVCPGLGDRWITPGNLIHGGSFTPVALSLVP